MLDHERARLRPGLLILGDKGFAGRDFAQAVAEHVPDCCVPIAPTSPAGWGRWVVGGSGSRAPSTPSTASSGWSATATRTLVGVWVRVAQRLLALASGIWWNWQTDQPNKRSLVAYDH